MTRVAVRSAIALITFASLFSSARAAAGPKQYALMQLHHLSTATGAYSVVSGINDNGIAVGSDWLLVQNTPPAIPTPRYQNALTWGANGSPTKLTNPMNSPFAQGLAINNSGNVAGRSDSNTTSGQPTRAALFTSGVGAIIPPANASNFAFASGINDAGTVAGNDSVLPFLYANGVKTLLSTSSTSFQAVSYAPVLVSEGGKAYASGRASNEPNERPYLLTATARTPLYTSTRRGLAFDVNRSEKVVGEMVTIDQTFGPRAPALFANGTVTILPGFGGTFGTAWSINDADVIVGGAGDFNFRQRAFRTIGTEIVDLNNLVAGLNGWQLRYASGINNRGQIVVNAALDHDQNTSTPPMNGSFRLDPIRTPGDTNYDNAINFADLLTLAQNYGRSGNGTVFWETGDFNFDWKVDFADLLTLARNYSRPASMAADWARAQALVPEPAALSFGAIALLLRRRRAAA